MRATPSVSRRWDNSPSTKTRGGSRHEQLHLAEASAPGMPRARPHFAGYRRRVGADLHLGALAIDPSWCQSINPLA